MFIHKNKIDISQLTHCQPFKMKLLPISLLAIFSLIVGVAIGYHTGVTNQLYYDAPAKIIIYSSLLKQNKADEYLDGQIFKQVMILNDTDLQKYTSELLLLLPPHGRDFHEAYKDYASRLPTNTHYIDANEKLRTFNKKHGTNTD